MITFLLQPHQKFTLHSIKEFVFRSFTQMKDDYTTNFHYLTYTFPFERLGDMYLLFEFGSERVYMSLIQTYCDEYYLGKCSPE